MSHFRSLAVLLLITTAPLVGQVTSPELVWTLQDDGAQWIGYYVSMGNQATQIFAHESNYAMAGVLLSPLALTPPLALGILHLDPALLWAVPLGQPFRIPIDPLFVGLSVYAQGLTSAPEQPVAKGLSFAVVLAWFRSRRQIAGESVDSSRSDNEELGQASAAAGGMTFATGCQALTQDWIKVTLLP